MILKKGGRERQIKEKKKNEGVVLHRKVKRNMKEVKESEAWNREEAQTQPTLLHPFCEHAP